MANLLKGMVCNMIKILDGTTKNPITKIGERAGVCWGSDISDPVKNFNRGMECLKSGHDRLLEFVDIEMQISGYSARCIREWYTHIGGAPTRIQASTRYINYGAFDCVIPESVKNNTSAMDIYEKALLNCQASMGELTKLGIPREDVAMLLPLGMTTTIVDKRNLRNLIEMSHVRMCNRAYHEYRDLMNKIAGTLAEISPEWEIIVTKHFKPKCEVYGYCTEKHSCGRKEKKVED